MNVQKQVCGLEQSRKLYTLGISKTGHLFSWVYDKLNTQWDISNRCVESLELTGKIAYPAFTVAELGVMLPENWEVELKYPKDMYCFNIEAWDRANLLLACLEGEIFGISDVNNRLNA